MSLLSEMGIKLNKSESYRRILLASLILDASGSTKHYSDNMVRAINRMTADLKNDPTMRDSVMMQIVTFNSRTEPVLEFTRIKDLPDDFSVKIEHRGKTHTGSAVLYALDSIEAKTKELREKGIHCYKPTVFLITDGNPDFKSAQKEEEEAKLEKAYERIRAFGGNFFSIGIGEYCDGNILDKLAGGEPDSHLMIDAVQNDIKLLFKLVTDTISRQTNGGEDITNAQFKEKLREIKDIEAKYSSLEEEDDNDL